MGYTFPLCSLNVVRVNLSMVPEKRLKIRPLYPKAINVAFSQLKQDDTPFATSSLIHANKTNTRLFPPSLMRCERRNRYLSTIYLCTKIVSAGVTFFENIDATPLLQSFCEMISIFVTLGPFRCTVRGSFHGNS